MFNRNESNQTFNQLPPSCNEDWDRPTMICAASQDNTDEQLCLVTAKANEFVFVIR